MAMHSSGLPCAYEIWDRWSAASESYQGGAATSAKWGSFGGRAGITIGTLFRLAKRAGWVRPLPSRRQEKLLPLVNVTLPPRKLLTAEEAQAIVRSVIRHSR